MADSSLDDVLAGLAAVPGVKWSLKGMEVTEYDEAGNVTGIECCGWRCSCGHATEAEHSAANGEVK